MAAASRLSPTERKLATALHRALKAAEQAIAAGERDAAAITGAAHAQLQQDVELEYFELVHPDTFAPSGSPIDGEVFAVVTARVGATRLIDNQPIQVPSTTAAATAGSTKAEEALACSARC